VLDAMSADAPTDPDAARACADISGAYVWAASCSIPEATISAHSCITQTGCTATILDSEGVFSQVGTVLSSATVVGNVVTSSAGGLTCTTVYEGDSATAHCESTSPAYTCDATGARVSFPGATQFCCDVVGGDCGAGERCQVVAGAAPEDRFTACVPAGEIAEGEPCTRAGGRIGADECGPGLTCTDDEMAKLHVRHMVGGRAPGLCDELLYRFEFPERPGALLNFLDHMSKGWNISLFHYRNHGADYGRVLVGMQVPKQEMKAFRAFLKDLGYRHWDETRNPAYQLFLGQA
jgi:hypothetical protein